MMSTRSTDSGPTRDKIPSSAPSTVSTPLLYYTRRPPGGGPGSPPRPARDHPERSNSPLVVQVTVPTQVAGGTPARPSVPGDVELVAGVRKVEDGLELSEEPAAAQHEQREEAGGDREIAQREREPGGRRDRGKHHEYSLEEDPHQAEDRNDDERSVPLGRPAGEALEQVRERDDPADHQHHPRQGRPRLHEDPPAEESTLDRAVAVPDHDVLRPEEVHPHDRQGELQLGDVLDGGRRDRGAPAGVGPDREDRQEAKRSVERADGEVAAEQATIPLRVLRHHEVESPQGDRHEPQHKEDAD